KAARLIGEVIGHLDEYVGDAFIEYRIKHLISKGFFEIESNTKAMRFFSVKVKE
ncbi:DUF3658 domain-containing protein, partial [Bacillus sp. JJ722]|uniref:DUF3658 domain-containing protein n=1 Tax=Bacillus sp. JJ722 TaxID=3122973 RepID=UPI003F68ABDB